MNGKIRHDEIIFTLSNGCGVNVTAKCYMVNVDGGLRQVCEIAGQTETCSNFTNGTSRKWWSYEDVLKRAALKYNKAHGTRLSMRTAKRH